MNIENEIRNIAKKSNFMAKNKSVSLAIGSNQINRWWFTDKKNNLVSSERGLTDIEALQWLAAENLAEIHRVRNLLKIIDEDEG